ncbi:MAG TPA: phosphatase PAP2 family protein [Candidatus Dormibacteraeota bacterium]
MQTLGHLRRSLLALGVLAIAFVVLSAGVSAGQLKGVDHQVASTMTEIWRPQLKLPMQAIALLGGVEVTTLVALGLFIYIRRQGFRSEAWALLAYPLAQLIELVYKRLVFQPGPPPSIQHGDAPSLTWLLGGSVISNSFPSGHMLRTVLVYGLLAFVVVRMSERPAVRRWAVPAAVVLCVAMAFDRVYLNVHWESDVLGGALLGALALAGAIIWLDRPRGVVA